MQKILFILFTFLCSSASLASLTGDSGSIIITKIENDQQCVKSIRYELKNEFYCILGLPFVNKTIIKNIDGFEVQIDFIDFGESRITIQDLSKVNLNEKDRQRANQESVRLRKILSKYSKPLWTNLDFQLPVDGVISSRYGKQRYINDQRRSPHLALDIAAPEGTNIIAPANGTVVLTDNFFYSGNLIAIDHGMGLFTTYSHLNKIKVNVGQKVKYGEVIGEVGRTGRVTGSHLHWSVYLTSTRINPESILRLKELAASKFVKN